MSLYLLFIFAKVFIFSAKQSSEQKHVSFAQLYC